MADKNIGSLPGITGLDSDSLFVAEQQGVAVKVSGLQLTRFANVETAAQVQAAAESAQAAAKSQAAASASEQAAAASAQEAQDASQAVQDMSVSATSVPNTSPISIEKTVDPETGAVSLAFSIPEGPTGPAGGVDSFNGRTGAVVPAAGDYNPELVGARPRKNFLRNWYFVGGGSQQGGGQLPINQRGQTSYTAPDATVQTIDGWKIGYQTTLTLDSAGVTLTRLTEDNVPLIDYTLSAAAISGLNGKTVTLSLLTDQEFITDSFTFGNHVVYGTKINISVYSDNIIRIASAATQVGQTTAHIIAAKLEESEGQTLAYQDSNGNWQIFETPDYTTELLRCQRYLWVGNTTALTLCPGSITGAERNGLSFDIPVGVQMADTLNFSFNAMNVYDSNGLVFNHPQKTFTVTSVQVSGNAVRIGGIMSAPASAQPIGVIVALSSPVITGTD